MSTHDEIELDKLLAELTELEGEEYEIAAALIIAGYQKDYPVRTEVLNWTYKDEVN